MTRILAATPFVCAHSVLSFPWEENAMENFFALAAIVVGSAILGLALAYGFRRKDAHRPPEHDDARLKF